MPLRRRSVLRIRTFALFSLTYGVVGLFWEHIETGHITIGGPSIGVVVGITLAALEESKIGKFTRSMPFTKAVVIKSALYLAALAIPVLITGFIQGFVRGLEIRDFFMWIMSADFPLMLLIIYLIHLVVSFALNLNRLLGPRTLLRYLLGTYHRPRVERRVFMFLDMKSSTTLAEMLGGKKYFSLAEYVFSGYLGSDPGEGSRDLSVRR